jgi:regulator of protease activity HflC (stomatin/prohibitin superfamily)
MSEVGIAHDRRAQHVALLGFVLQLTAFCVLLGISLWADSHVLAALCRFVLPGIPIWFVLYLVFNQMRRVAVEGLETAELRRAREAGTSQAIFEMDEESLLLEQNRLKWMVRWLLPAVTIVVSALLLAGHLVAWGWSLDNVLQKDVLKRTEQPTLWMWFVVSVGFVFFLYARYALALSRLPQWRLLRAGAVYVAGNSLSCLGVAIALMAAGTIEWAEPLVAYIIRVVLLLLGVEFAVNFVLDLYRPRIPGEVPRPSFDSRLLGMIGEPGGIAKSIADAMNYQFGFQVSSTWFYQLLQRWLFPIMVFALAVVLALTSVVIVDADEEAVVERFGRLLGNPPMVLSPGIHVKWPYPIDIVRRAPVRRINELVIGEATQEDDQDMRRAVLWTEAHEYVPELMLLVASPQLDALSAGPRPPADLARAGKAAESVAVSLLMVSLPIEYRIKDITKYLYTYNDPEELMEAVTYQYLSDYAAGVDIDLLMGPGRESFNRELRKLIQQRLDEVGVGIEIVFAGIRGAHPTEKNGVAAAFQSVVSAQTNMAATINAADGAVRKVLTAATGKVERAQELDEAILVRDRLPADSPELGDANQRVTDFLLGNPAKGIAPVSGNAAVLIADARARANRMMSAAGAKARVFDTHVAAYRAAPALYKCRKTLEVFEVGLDNIRKYLIVGDPSGVLIEYETAKEAGLDQVLSEGVEKERKTYEKNKP